MILLKTSFIFFLWSIASGVSSLQYGNDIDLMKIYKESISRDVTDDQGCRWRTLNSTEQCSETEINFFFYFGKNEQKIRIDPLEKNSLQETLWDPHKHNIIYVHGYGSGEDIFPTTILKNAYINNGSYNLFVVDWSPFAKTPCYGSAIHNLNAVARCTAQLHRNLRSQGIPSDRITCLGHDLGAHGCGLISKHVEYRLHRIIGLDPAGSMITNDVRLKPEMARYVQAIYTNAGAYGDTNSNGRVNFCVNGGKTQPICKNATVGSDLCSHFTSVCFMAESIDGSKARKAQPCARQCPTGPRKDKGPGQPVLFGQHTPNKISGSYCVHTDEIPYCSRWGKENGHPWCCLDNV